MEMWILHAKMGNAAIAICTRPVPVFGLKTIDLKPASCTRHVNASLEDRRIPASGPNEMRAIFHISHTWQDVCIDNYFDSLLLCSHIVGAWQTRHTQNIESRVIPQFGGFSNHKTETTSQHICRPFSDHKTATFSHCTYAKPGTWFQGSAQCSRSAGCTGRWRHRRKGSETAGGVSVPFWSLLHHSMGQILEFSFDAFCIELLRSQISSSSSLVKQRQG
jgi:hypothetical protein